MRISLENVYINTFDFSSFPNLNYVYLSSQSDRIVGGGNSGLLTSSKGDFLVNTVSTLPQRSDAFRGKILIREVAANNNSYEKVWITSQNQSQIENAYAIEKNWSVVWDSGITNNGL